MLKFIKEEINVRGSGEYKNKALFIPSGYSLPSASLDLCQQFTWELKKDLQGLYCLIPTIIKP